MIQTSRVYEESIGLQGAFHESMSYFLLGILILIISLPNTLWKIDIVSLEERSHLIKIQLHAGMLRVESLLAVGTLDFLLALMSFVLVFLRAGRLLLLILFFRLWSIYFSLWILLLPFSF